MHFCTSSSSYPSLLCQVKQEREILLGVQTGFHQKYLERGPVLQRLQRGCLGSVQGCIEVGVSFVDHREHSRVQGLDRAGRNRLAFIYSIGEGSLLSYLPSLYSRDV